MGRRGAARVVATLMLAGTAPLGVAPAPAGTGPQEAPVEEMPAGPVVPGASSWLARDDGGVLMAMHTAGLEAGTAYSVWWVVFNRPEACLARPTEAVRCGEADLVRPAAEASALFAAGGVAAGRGDGFFGGRLTVGDLRGCQAELPCRAGLTNPAGAEVHLVVRSHGPVIPDRVDAQITTFNGGCHAGEPNEGQCRNVQASAFPAP